MSDCWAVNISHRRRRKTVLFLILLDDACDFVFFLKLWKYKDLQRRLKQNCVVVFQHRNDNSEIGTQRIKREPRFRIYTLFRG